MNAVYLIAEEAGEYYSPTLGAFSTPEKAEAAMALRPDIERWYDIQQIEVDSLDGITPPGGQVGPWAQEKLKGGIHPGDPS